ncbi:hypothetical protein [Parahaliea mediterranea]|uniref:hypothetical protein n=1 Tax=Parahaliea mediterranea TaxID=651086 RepID=UPI000E2F193D|nr:hypothetical protein [Parahaliea mediterranea]
MTTLRTVQDARAYLNQPVMRTLDSLEDLGAQLAHIVVFNNRDTQRVSQEAMEAFYQYRSWHEGDWYVAFRKFCGFSYTHRSFGPKALARASRAGLELWNPSFNRSQYDPDFLNQGKRVFDHQCFYDRKRRPAALLTQTYLPADQSWDELQPYLNMGLAAYDIGIHSLHNSGYCLPMLIARDDDEHVQSLFSMITSREALYAVEARTHPGRVVDQQRKNTATNLSGVR